MDNAKKIVTSATMVALLVLVSKMLGLFRDVFVASKFGSGYQTDAFFIATTASLVIANILNTSIKTTLIPILSEIRNSDGDNKVNIFTNNLLVFLAIVTTLLTILAFNFAPAIVKLLAVGFKGEQFELTVKLSRLGFPMIIFMVLSAVFTAFLQSNKSFGISSFVSGPFNLVYIFYLLLFSKKYGIEGLMIASIFAALSQVLVQIPTSFKHGFRPKFSLDFRDVHLLQMITMTGPILIGTMSQQVNVIISQTLASGLVAGSISALSYGGRLNGLIYNIFIVAATTVVFPMLSDSFSNKDYIKFEKSVRFSINFVVLFALPLTILIILLSKPIVMILFFHGEFGMEALEMTSSAFSFYTIGLVGYGLADILNKVFYSMKNTMIPMYVGITTVVINIIFNLIMIKHFQHNGLALATSVSGLSSALALMILLRNKLEEIKWNQIFETLKKAFLASIIMLMVDLFILALIKSFGMYQFTVVNQIIICIIISASSVVSYIISCYILKIREFEFLYQKLGLK